MESEPMTDPAKLATFRFHIEADADSGWHDMLERLGLQHLEPGTPLPVPDTPTPDQLILKLARREVRVKIEALDGEQAVRTVEGDAEGVNFPLVLPVLTHAVEPNGIAIEIYGPTAHALLSLSDVDPQTVREVAARNALAGWVLPDGARDALQPKGPEAFKPTRKRRPSLAPLAPTPPFSSDRVFKGCIEAISNPDVWADRGDGRFRRVYRIGDADARFRMEVGYRADLAIAEQVWERLRMQSEAVIKAHFVLWARAYEQDPGLRGKWVALSIQQFLDDCGVKRDKGSHKAARKRDAKEWLEALLNLHIEATFAYGKGKQGRLSGAVWTRGLEAETRDTYADLFGSTRAGIPGEWEPEGISYAIGPYFHDETWRRFNNFTGRFARQFVELRIDRDQYAIRIGAYLHSVGRFGQYGPVRCKVGELLKKAGIPVYDNRNWHKTREKCEAAFNTLRDRGIKGDWRYDGGTPTRRDEWLHQTIVFEPGEWEKPERERLEPKTMKLKALTGRPKRPRTRH